MVSSNVEGNIENKSVFCIFVTFSMDPNWKTIVKTQMFSLPYANFHFQLGIGNALFLAMETFLKM